MQNLYISKYPNCANVRRICQQNGYLFRKILTFDGRENNVFHDGKEDLVVTIIIWTVEHQSHDEGSHSLDLVVSRFEFWCFVN